MEDAFMSSLKNASPSALPDAAGSSRCDSLRRAGPAICAALILVTAGSLKGHQLATDPALGVLYGSRWFETGLAEYELLLAAWLLSGTRIKLCRRIAFVTFVGFGCASFYFGISGRATCGCFGGVHVNPWWTFALDVGIAWLLWLWTPTRLPGRITTPRNRTLTSSLAAVAMFGALIIPVSALTGLQHVSVVTDGGLAGEGSIVVLEPEKWIGKPFALANSPLKKSG